MAALWGFSTEVWKKCKIFVSAVSREPWHWTRLRQTISRFTQIYINFILYQCEICLLYIILNLRFKNQMKSIFDAICWAGCREWCVLLTSYDGSTRGWPMADGRWKMTHNKIWAQEKVLNYYCGEQKVLMPDEEDVMRL